MLWFKFLSKCFVVFLLFGFHNNAGAQHLLFSGWKTNTGKSLIDLNELKRGGPPKDGIPSIDDPRFITSDRAQAWLTDNEPVILVEISGEARAYPLQVLIWHEIVNEEIQDTPVLVTFCPLCYSALVFERTVEGEILEFGVSGFLRHSDLVMFDRKTETLWQQVTGKAIVGDYAGTQLRQLPSQIISFQQFRNAYPNGKVLSKDTGYDRNYGTNPYAGYDDINNTPLFGDVDQESKLPPMEKVIGVKIGEIIKAYPYTITRSVKVINDVINNEPVVIFHIEGARSALDAQYIAESREDGSTGAFKRVLNGTKLTFNYESGSLKDEQTGSEWDITGKAIAGPLTGERLKPVNSGVYFAFAWMVFWPDTQLYSINK